MRTISTIAIIAAFSVLSLTANALTEEVDGIVWTYTVTNGEAVIGGGGAWPAISQSTTGAITIPSSLGGYPVTSIGVSAFNSCTGLTSVTIPEGVTSIGDLAFHCCLALANVTIPDSVTSIGHSAFTVTAITELKIPDNISSLGVFVSGSESNYQLQQDWTKKYNAELAKIAQKSLNGTLHENPRYDLSTSAGDRKIATVTVSGDTALDEFVLTEGKVYDAVLYIKNTVDKSVKMSMPAGNEYMVLKGANPLRIPANSRNILTITRISDDTFLLSREELEVAQ